MYICRGRSAPEIILTCSSDVKQAKRQSNLLFMIPDLFVLLALVTYSYFFLDTVQKVKSRTVYFKVIHCSYLMLRSSVAVKI